jgi:hypothetical protein
VNPIAILHVTDRPGADGLSASAAPEIPLQLRLVTTAERAMTYLIGLGRCADRANHPFPQIVLIDLDSPHQMFALLDWIKNDFFLEKVFVAVAIPPDFEFPPSLQADACLPRPVDGRKVQQLICGAKLFPARQPVVNGVAKS